MGSALCHFKERGVGQGAWSIGLGAWGLEQGALDTGNGAKGGKGSERESFNYRRI